DVTGAGHAHREFVGVRRPIVKLHDHAQPIVNRRLDRHDLVVLEVDDAGLPIERRLFAAIRAPTLFNVSRRLQAIRGDGAARYTRELAVEEQAGKAFGLAQYRYFVAIAVVAQAEAAGARHEILFPDKHRADQID